MAARGYIDVARILQSTPADLSFYVNNEYMNTIHTTTPPKYQEMLYHLVSLYRENKEAYSSFIHSLVKSRGQDTLAFYMWSRLGSALYVRVPGWTPVHDILRDELILQGHQVAGTRKNRKRRRSVSRKRRKNRKTKKGGRRVSRKSSKKSYRKSKRRTNKSRRRRK